MEKEESVARTQTDKESRLCTSPLTAKEGGFLIGNREYYLSIIMNLTTEVKSDNFKEA